MLNLFLTLALGTAAPATADLPRIFMTSATGAGDLSSWPDAHGLSGLAAADEICRTAAASANIAHADEYIAYLSDSQNDLYCRVHRLGGGRVNQCGFQSETPTGAGPWYRMDDEPAMDIAENSLGPFGIDHYVPRHLLYNEFGQAFPEERPAQTSLAFHSSALDGRLYGADPPCGDWTSADPAVEIPLSGAYRAFDTWPAFYSTCDQPRHLTCLQSGRHGAALSRKRPSTARIAFLSSASGSGRFADWPQSGGIAGVDGADAVCRSLAGTAGLPLPESYRAWLATEATSARRRFFHDGPWYRVDGVRVAASLDDLLDRVIDAPLQLDENGQTSGFSNVWTGAQPDGPAIPEATCGDWMDDTAYGSTGLNTTADTWWAQISEIAFNCTAPFRLYCFADNDSLFLDGFER